ncbi:MAG: SIR2 family protein [Lachnospiraceae bacterium]|nr:SIR2 family protein [Lachnospiraceae bacterium]
MAEIYLSKRRDELEKFLNIVAEEILQGNISLFLGAGSSMQYNAPNWSDLISSVYKGYKNGNNVDKAQYAELKGINIKTEISKQTSLLKIDVREKNTYLNYLLNFDYKSIWTTNYDQIIEKVLDQKARNYKPIYKYSHFKDLPYPGECFLFKINGSYNDPKTIVVTKEDFINYRKSHEAYLILLKRELLCHSFLFLGCSFEDDILRICIKDILNCIENSDENYVTNHFAIIVEKNAEKLEFISKDLSYHYNIKCLTVSNAKNAYKIAYGISCKVKYNSIFISGAKKYTRHSLEENIGKRLCQNLVESFMNIRESPFKFFSGMGMSIGHFICGTIKQKCKGKNINRYLQMEPFPFSSGIDNEKHRENLINKAGIFIYIFGDLDEVSDNIENSGMWKEYMLAKFNKDNIIIPLPCGEDSISKKIYDKEKADEDSFSASHCNFLEAFDYRTADTFFFDALVEKIILKTRQKMDLVMDELESDLNNKY